MSEELYDQEKDPKEDKPFTFKDAHALAGRLTVMSRSGVGSLRKNMGHGAECPQCSQGILEETEQDLGRDHHFRKAMNIHNDTLGENS